MDQTYLAQIIDWVDEWKPVLRLQDWQIRCEVCRADSMDGAYGTCKAIASKRQALIRILDPDEVIPHHYIWEFDLEQVVVHELLHCYTHLIEDAQEIENSMMLEQMVDGLAWTLVAMKRSGADMTQVRLLMG